jgi:hypothetical protein
VSGEGTPLLEELSELRWLRPEELVGLKTTTEGLAEIVDSAFRLIEGHSTVIPGERA